MFQSHENTAVSAAILWLTVCVCDVVNRADICGGSVCYVRGQPFFFFLERYILGGWACFWRCTFGWIFYLVFPRMPGESYRRRFRSLLFWLLLFIWRLINTVWPLINTVYYLPLFVDSWANLFLLFIRYIETPRVHLHMVGMLWFVSDINQPSLPSPFYSVLASISVFMALSTVFHFINSPDNLPFSDTVLPVLSLLYWSFQLFVSLWKSPSALT